MTKATGLITPMIERALRAGINAKYVLMDSWFGVPSLIAKARKHLDVICMVKRTPKIHYIFEGQELNAIQIYRKIRKRRGKAKVLAKAQVQMKDGGTAKLVFVRNRSKKDWLALLCTDKNLPDEEIVRIYGRRWDIEVFFRTAKQHLELEKGCQSRDFDALIAHTSIVMPRYIFLSIEKRRADDPRTLGILFHHFCEEAVDCTLIEALSRILGEIVENLHKIKAVPANIRNKILEMIQENLDSFISEKPFIINKNMHLIANA
ncbi:transposase [Desulfoplanes formicivorans]|uniref:Transposase n=2 Tax=Desulfoplanes formicivorans TaxID=1592317 RepID=A0A194AGC5_9BACT|nr:transposase [Desulfoplanes formicivorans]